ncbi:MAG: tetratricopeptide repeat protein [Roseivirga sp.]
MYTQSQRGLSMVLLTSLFLQSCGNLALNGHQLREEARAIKEADSSEELHTATPTAPQAQASSHPSDARSHRQVAGHSPALSSMMSREQRSTASSTSPPQWGTTPALARRLQRMASTTKPHMALMDSQGRKITFEYAAGGQWQATVEEITGKRVLPVIFEPGYSMERLQGLEKSYQKQRIHVLKEGVYVGEQGLRGGVIGAELAAGLALQLVGSPIRFLVEGNKKDVEREQRAQLHHPIRVQAQLDGRWIEGVHRGPRMVELLRPRGWFGFRPPMYHLVAQGEGSFTAEGEVSFIYQGYFLNNLFHDNTGEARCSIGHTLRYQGGFQQGRRHGHGTLERYDYQRGDFYLHYRGTWENDAPATGTYYDTDGQSRARLENGRYVSPPDAARFLTQMGTTHADAGRHQEALEYHEQALEIRRSLYPDQNHVEVGQSLFNVGEAYRHLGRHQEAIEVARSLHKAGVAYGNLGQHQESLRHYEQALEMRRALYPNQNHADVAQSLNNAGVAYGRLGQHQESLRHYEQALEMRRALYPNQNHADVALSLNNVGIACHNLGRHQEARKHYEEALAMYRQLYPTQPNHPDFKRTTDNLNTLR